MQQNMEDLDERLTSVEAELMGDANTGRPSLRREMDRRLNVIQTIAIAILIVVLGKVVGDWVNAPTAKAATQQYVP
jgi:hypothetical protein